jgi:hypothetical protein
MKDFLANLIARSFADTPAIQPRMPSLFESAAADPFTEVQSSAPTAAPVASKSSANSPEILKATLASTQPTIAQQPANATDPVAEERQFQTDEAGHEHTVTTPSPRPSGERAGVRGFEFETKGHFTPAISSPDRENLGSGSIKQLPQTFSEPRAAHSKRRNSFPPVEPRSSASAPVIHVTIGRVEVRAIQSVAPVPKSAKPAPPKLSLDDYLRKRDGGSRE